MKYANLLRSTALVFAALATPSFAQTNAQDNQSVQRNAPTDTEDDEAIVVTGTNIRGVAPVGADAAVITREDIQESGQSQVSEILRQLPQAQNNSAFSDQPLQNNPYGGQAGGFVVSNETRGSAVDLRGLGPNATLILVDGRRQLPTGTTDSFVEANRVPPSALERIEVVTDGASAIYGSDAVAGVVNYITRKDYEGLEASSRYTFNDSQEQWGAAITGGTMWELGGRRGNIIASYDYDHRDLVTGADNPRFGADQTAYGGNNSIYAAGTNPTPFGAGYYSANVCPLGTTFYYSITNTCYNLSTTPIGNLGAPTVQYYDIPDGTTGRPAASAAQAFPTNVQSSDRFRTFQPEQTRNALNVYVNQELTPWLSAYAQVAASERVTRTVSSTFTAVTVANQSPYFPLFSTSPAPTSVTVPLHGLPTITREAEDYQDSITLGLRAELGSEWEGEFYATRSSAEYSPGADSASSRAPSQDALSRLALRGEFNPFVNAPVPQNILDLATYQGSEDLGGRSNAEAWDYVLKFNGPLFELPGGTVRAAAGAEHSTFENNYLLSSANSTCPAGTTPTAARCTLAYDVDEIRSGSAERDVSALFGEIYIPIVGENNALPLVERFAVNLAARWEDYSDFGETVNPRVGFTWDLNQEFSIRGSWGESFRAPNLIEISASSLPYVFTNPDTRTGTPISTIQLTLNGANPNLQPETATNWSLGFDYSPDWLEGFNIAASYYEVDYQDKINVQNVTLFLDQESAALYAPYVTDVTPWAGGPAAGYPGCDPSDPTTYAPEVAAVMSTRPQFEQTVGDICRVQIILDGRWQNAASVLQTGMDLNISYGFSLGENDFDASLNVTKIFSIEETLVANGPMTTPEPLNRIFMPLDFRARANFRWQHGPFSAGLAVNYTPSYTNDVGFIRINPPPAANSPAAASTEVDSWTTADLSLAYNIDESDSFGLLNGVRIGFNITNITDEDAPVVLTGTSLNTSYDGRVHNPFGRTFNVQLTKTF